MQAFRLCRANYPAYLGEGARRVGGRWNSKGARVLYMSENRSLAMLEILVHLSASLPDRYILGGGAPAFPTMSLWISWMRASCRQSGPPSILGSRSLQGGWVTSGWHNGAR